jgi:uncharacterized phage protein (TIGR02218 family)
VSYLTEEQSAESGRPIELVRITLGSAVYRYTSAAEDIVVEGDTWNSTEIDRDRTEEGAEVQDSKFSIRLPGDNQFAQQYELSAPSEVAVLEVLSVHFGDATDPLEIWAGEIVEVEWVEDTAWVVLSARPIEGAMDASIPKYDSGVLCPYMLYSTKCGVSRASHQYSNVAGSVSGDTLTVSGIDASKGVGWADGGDVWFGDEKRVVLRHTATDTLQLGSPFLDDPTGETVTVYAGCDHSLDGAHGCDSKFSNSVNFGGKHYVPVKDVWRNGVV